MKRVYKYLLVFLGSLFLFPLVSNAECSYERQAELSKIASNVQFSYTYEVVEGTPQFNVNIINLTNDIYVQYTNDMFRPIISGVGEKTIAGTNGSTMNFARGSENVVAYAGAGINTVMHTHMSRAAACNILCGQA